VDFLLFSSDIVIEVESRTFVKDEWACVISFVLKPESLQPEGVTVHFRVAALLRFETAVSAKPFKCK